ncbi:MAG: hypothetical protein AUK44_04035 [Porphyromonadaceae bacterium CG2_30_38_12]|nr:MAG: hypothetical protein AUK44_04035 [Porphyromonadaceae bacterium CG2_30_38_12]
MFLLSCQDEIFTVDTSKKLSFSTDTLTFDTIFTSIGSTTEKFLIYNNNKQALRISRISLAAGTNSKFRINVDGTNSQNNVFTNIEIAAKDSMFVFVETTINPTADANPILIEDSVVFEFNGNKQGVLLEAFGQNMHLIKSTLLTKNTTLLTDKPYLIYDYLAIDFRKTLTIPAGCKLYFHNNANLIIYGNLITAGTFENPVSMQGDRLDKVKFLDPVSYNYVAGQWGGVYFLSPTGNHKLKNTNITSGYVGIYSPNEDRSTLPTIDIENCKIHNFVYYGIVAQNTNVTVKNSEISNTGSYTVFLNGGKHVFLQSTIANYYANNSFEPSSRDKTPAVMIMGLQRSAPMQTEFVNCIVSGTMDNELSIASRFLTDYKGAFSYSYIKRKDKYELSQFKHIRWYNFDDTVFKQSTYNYEQKKYFDFMPDSISPARHIADPATASRFPFDLNGKNRFSDGEPDAGAYEWLPTSQNN